MQKTINPKKKTLRAFTIIELLVVIAIIGLLSMITLMSLSSATFRGRDTKTIAQLSQIPSALSIIYASEGEYDEACLDEDNFSLTSGLRDIQLELSSRNKSIKCFADGDNYCISSELNTGEYYIVKNNHRFTDEEGCTSSIIGGGLGEGNTPIISWACGDTFVDTRDSKEYTTVEIGTQCWMKENLAYLPVVHSNAEFAAKGTALEPGYGVYDYDGSDIPTAKATTNYQTYGVLYNWYAAIISCPEDWHLPTDAEKHILDNFLTDEGQTCNPSRNNVWDCSTAGTKMKTASWGGNNSSGFTALPGGHRGSAGSFNNIGSYAYFWSSLESSSSNAWRRSLNSSEARVFRLASNKATGFSVRCLRDN